MSTLLKLCQSLVAVSLLAGVVIGFSVLGIRNTSILEPLELTVYDWLIQSRRGSEGPDPRIVLITVTEQDILNQGRWPITDAILAQALERLVRFQPRAIGLDIYRDIPVDPGHTDLNRVFVEHPQIITVTKLAGGTMAGIPPPPVLAGTEQVAFNDILIDSDGIVRRGLLFQEVGDQTAYGFAIRLAFLFLAEEGIAPQPSPDDPEQLRLGPTTLRRFGPSDGGYVGADAGGYQILLDFHRGQNPPPSFSLTALLTDQVEAEAIRNKIVLFGVTAESVPDLFHTPFSSGNDTGRMIPGVVVHAHVISQLLGAAMDGRRPSATLNESQEWLWTLLWGLCGAGIGAWIRSPWRLAFSAAGGLFILCIIVVVAFAQGWWIPLVPPAMAWFLSGFAVTVSVLSLERKERALLMHLFSKHVSGEVAEAVWRQREQFLQDGRPRPQQLTATVFFSDFKGYTAASEKMTPEALMHWVNAYLDVMAGLVIKHGGVIDDYAGDAIKANFGVPLPRNSEEEIAQDAVNAVTCALAMEQQMHRLNMQHSQEGLATIGMRIGIHTGLVVAGSVGTSERLKYTTVGDAVNTAARLESLDRDIVQETPGRRLCRILIDEGTKRYLDNRFVLDRIGEVSVKGKEQTLMVYRVIGHTQEVKLPSQ
ncbi:MAG TPA: adenylate/guanylate cyclase domain-containing protein [Nitrospiraceae bacterium]|nr:adenylate/guanylate cyclase domain-containing protein [Nitrospiraceae bacterium]